MSRRDWWKSRFQDYVMTFMDELRSETIGRAEGDVLEVGFGTGLNLRHYDSKVKRVTGLDPLAAEGFDKLDRRIEAAAFPVERCILGADGELPFDAGRFDSVVTTWTLCSIPDAAAALAQMKRVLKPGGCYVFVEHGRSDSPGTARWQDRLNPIWNRIADGCNLNRQIDEIVADAGFELEEMTRFRAKGPAILAHMYRGVATRT